MAFFKNVRHWAHGLLAGFIGGGAGAVSGAVGPMLIDPSKFNLADTASALNILKTMATGFVVCGLLNAFSYLKQSPVPPEGNGDTQMLRKEDVK